jgi:hypothetical protein
LAAIVILAATWRVDACEQVLSPADKSSPNLILPQGSAPVPLVSQHFPDRVHAFVWRNWNAVEPARLAAILGTSTEQVTALAAAMGLPPAVTILPAMKSRGYITLIRRNWHLLPYDQLLDLVEMTPERLDFALREDDFLWIKLGSLKPRCERLRYQAPGDTAKRRAAEIRRVVEETFGRQLDRPAEPRFAFVGQLHDAVPALAPPRPLQDRDAVRMVYSYVAVYGDPLLHPELNPYPDGLLQRLSAVGINGVWLHAVLRDLAPGGPAFPEFGTDHERRLAGLRELVTRAQRFGIGVYLYINEPRAMPAAFFKNRPEIAGVESGGRGGDLKAMCTSHPAVRRWLADSLAHVFRQVPNLAGVYTITASENLTNCASLGTWQSCPRCKSRSDTDILAEVAAVIEEGVQRGNPRARILMSDWGWRGHGVTPDLIPRLPRSACLMSVSEWAKPIVRGGIASEVGEYSLSAVGPGPRARKQWDSATRAGLKKGTEIQFNNTCEIASLPYLPVMDLVAEHCRNLVPFNLDAMLIGWTMGGYPSPNFQLAQRLSMAPDRKIDAVLDELARERFGPAGGPHARRAWTLMSDAFREYPFHISVVYTSPVQIGPANPLYPYKTTYRATMWGIPYDDLDAWRGPYPPGVFADQFDKVVAGWRSGIVELKKAVEHTPADRRADALADLRLALAAAIKFQSVANQTRFVVSRNTLASRVKPLSPEQRLQLHSEIKRCVESEIALARELYPLVQEDSRIGFEPSCQYFYLPLDLVEKVVNCRWLLEQPW